MVNKYVQKLAALIDRVDPATPGGKAIDIKPFFGGAAGYLNGHIFISLTRVGLALKLTDDDRRRLFEAGDAKALRYFPKAPIKRQYALMSDEYLARPKRIRPWIEKSLSLVAGSSDGG